MAFEVSRLWKDGWRWASESSGKSFFHQSELFFSFLQQNGSIRVLLYRTSEPHHEMFGTKQKKKAEWVQTALERYERPLLQYAMSILQDIDRARDVVQDTFMRLHSQDQEQIEGYLSQWLFTVCRNCALKSLKKEERYIYVEQEEFETKKVEHFTPAMELERKERTDRLMELVQELPKNQYEVVRLRFMNHHSYQEISEITGLSVGNVGFLLNAAMRNLRSKMERDDKDEKIIYLTKIAQAS